MDNKLAVKCPHCQKKFLYHSSEDRPFCSQKCKMVDLGNWFNEGYVVEGKSNTVYIEDPELLGHMSDED